MNLKELMEKKAAKQSAMKALVDKAEIETRTLTAEEMQNFDDLEKEVRELSDTIRAIEATRSMEIAKPAKAEPETRELTAEEIETRDVEDFANFVKGVEVRTDSPMTVANNTAVIPKTIAAKIIAKVEQLSPLFKDADRYDVKGDLVLPKYTESNDSAITCDYADEFTDGTANSGNFSTITLKSFLGRAIAVVSKSLINSSAVNITNFVSDRMAKAIARFIDKEILNGTNNKVTGLSDLSNVVTAAATTAITADELIDLQEAVDDSYQDGAYFVMNKKTRTAIRKLKDGQNNYLLNKDANSRWGYTLFGKDVYVSSQMPEMAASATAIYYGDYSEGLAVKVSEDINTEILRETKARQHAVEVLGFVEFDAKVENEQAVAKLVMAAS